MQAGTMLTALLALSAPTASQVVPWIPEVRLMKGKTCKEDPYTRGNGCDAAAEKVREPSRQVAKSLL